MGGGGGGGGGGGCFFFQAEDGIRDLVRSRGLGDVYKRQAYDRSPSIYRRWNPMQSGMNSRSNPCSQSAEVALQ